MSPAKELLNKVNLITLSRIALSIIGVLLLFSGNIRLLIIAYAVMGLSEVSDVIDGYVARREKLVTNFGKILDPLSDSISRFFYFFAFAYHGLFPIWYMIFFFSRDIIVAYVRIYASFSGTVMSARVSGKVKGAFQFAGQYLLMLALMINTYQDSLNKPDYNYFLYATIIGSIAYLAVLVIFKIKGKLLAILISLGILLGTLLLLIPYATFHVNYLITFIVIFVTLIVTLYSLVDYICSLENSVKEFPRILSTLGLVIFMFFLSPYFLDGLKYKFESNPTKVKLDVLKDYKNITVGCSIMYNNIKITPVKNNDCWNLDFYKNEKLISSKKLDNKITDILSSAVIDNNLYILNGEENEIWIYSLNQSTEGVINCDFVVTKRVGLFFDSKSLTGVRYNNKNYLVLQDNVGGRKLYFIDIKKITDKSSIIKNYEFSITTEFYIKGIYSSGNSDDLYILSGKFGKDLIYLTSLNKLITSKSLDESIVKIWSTGEYEGVDLGKVDDKLVILSCDKNKLIQVGI